MLFNIELKSNNNGILKIGSFEEKIYLNQDYWNIEEYKKSWLNAIDNVLSEHKNTAIITSMSDIKNANFIEWWPMYIQDRQVIIQNHILFIKDIRHSVSENNLFSFIPKYNSHNEDGEKISQWMIPLHVLEKFHVKVS